MIIKRIIEMYRVFRPILLVLIIAAIFVFVNSYPSVPDIAEETNDYRQQVKIKEKLNDTERDELVIKAPSAPSLPNTITPVVSPEEINQIVNPEPKPKPKPTPPDGSNETIIDTTPDSREPPLEIKLFTGFLNVAPLILIAALGGFGIYLLFKYKKHFTLRSMFGLAIGLVTVCTIIFFGIIVLNFIEFLYDFEWDSEFIGWLLLPFGILLGAWISHSIISKRTTVFRRNMGLAIVGAFMGAFLTAFLPFWIIFILLVGITLFDIYSVKFGPIKKIMELESEANNKRTGKKIIYRKTIEHPNLDLKNVDFKLKDDQNEPIDDLVIVTMDETTTANIAGDTMKTTPSQPNSGLQPTRALIQKNPRKIKRSKQKDEEFDLMLMYNNPKWSLGLGDFVIYSMFTSVVLTYTMIYLPYYIFYSPILGLILPWLIFFLCTVGLLIGFFITLNLLEKRDYLPGLPISISLGLSVFVICILILQIINYLLYSEFVIII